jgi:hypothetical protein
MKSFDELGYVDHQCFFALYEMLDAQGNLINPQRLEYETALLKQRLHAAADDGITVYHTFGRSLTEFLTYDNYDIYDEDEPRRAAAEAFRHTYHECLELAQQLGIRIGFSINQFTFAHAVYDKLGDAIGGEGEGAAPVCPANEFAWQLYRDMLHEFFTYCPVDIIQLTTNETQVNVVDCKCQQCSNLNTGDRIVKLTNETHTICQQHGVELQLRSWGEMEDEGFFDRISDAIPDDIAVSVKNTNGDFHLHVPMHPMIGYTGKRNRSQIVEFDAWREFSGWNGFPCFMGYRYQQRLQQSMKLGVKRLTLRLTWIPNQRLIEDIPWGNDLNRRVFLALYDDPDLDVDAWLRDALKEFAPIPSEELFELYRDSSQELEASYYPDGRYMHSHSTVCNPWEVGRSALMEIKHWSNAAWIPDAPTAEQLESIAKENATRWNRMIKRVVQLKGSIDEIVYADLLSNTRGQRYLLEILPRLGLIRSWLEQPDDSVDYGKNIDHLRDLALQWQAAAPQHFEEKLGHFVFKVVYEARLWLQTRRADALTPINPTSKT